MDFYINILNNLTLQAAGSAGGVLQADGRTDRERWKLSRSAAIQGEKRRPGSSQSSADCRRKRDVRQSEDAKRDYRSMQ